MMGFLLMFLTIAVLMFGFTWALRAFGLTDSVGSGERPPAIGAAELERLHEAMAALDSRLDRLEDQQRFIERLLAERPEGRALPPGQAREERDGGADSILFDTERESP